MRWDERAVPRNRVGEVVPVLGRPRERGQECEGQEQRQEETRLTKSLGGYDRGCVFRAEWG